MSMKMLAPGTAATYSVADGTLFTPAPDGTLDVAIQYVGQLTLLGWTPVADVGVDPTAGRPLTGLQLGMMWWDSTLQKPIWWAGAQWKDATGAVV